MTQRSFVAVVALCVGSQACGSSSSPSTPDAGTDKTAKTVVAAPERDAASAEMDAMVAAPKEESRDASLAADSGKPAAHGGMKHAGAGGSAAKSTAAGGTGGAGAQADEDAGSVGATAEDPKSFAAAFSELFVDMPCDPATPTPIPEGMACSHAPNTQAYEKTLSFGGKPGTHYTLTLRVRAIWEPTEIVGGQDPYPGVPFTIGGSPPLNMDGTPTNAINYQQFQIQVAEPAQTYWLNNYHAAAHEIHQEDYQASFEVAAGSQIKIIVHDGNDLEIGNFRQLMFSDFPPYDKMPSLGQSVRFDVVKVEQLTASRGTP